MHFEHTLHKLVSWTVIQAINFRHQLSIDELEVKNGTSMATSTILSFDFLIFRYLPPRK